VLGDTHPCKGSLLLHQEYSQAGLGDPPMGLATLQPGAMRAGAPNVLVLDKPKIILTAVSQPTKITAKAIQLAPNCVLLLTKI